MTGEPPSPADVPDALAEYEQWVGWRSEERDEKQTKIPIDPSTGQYASSTDPETWGGFEAAVAAVERGDGAGVGFVFTDEDPFVGVDLDDCRDPESGEPAQWAAEIIETLNSYTEVSPSGTGYHVLVCGTLPEGRNRHGDVELYETARYFTVTGAYVGRQRTIHERPEELAAVHRKHVAQTSEDTGDEGAVAPGTPTDPSGSVGLSDDDLLEKARSAQNGQKFSALWRGDTSGYDSHSEADMALCCLLAFWTGGDAAQIDRLFRESGLLRGKWDDIHFADGSTYGEKTVERAITATSEFYNPDGGRTRRDDSSVSDTSNAPAESTGLVRKLREVVEQNHQLTVQVDALTETVEQQAETIERQAARLESLETRLAAVEDELDEAEPTGLHDSARVADQRSNSVATSTGDTDSSSEARGGTDEDSGSDTTDSFMGRARRFVGKDSE
ncbi:phage NrS-1 polymerase family protein [Halomarina oriensis]|uniref:phage NrS-1 polymerase family protein n=1 Tax=Halomarina oriensis TaxID=671145 RepID=UPI0018EEFD7A|nr:hypothetical protein [Halomarina oriensis]